MSVLSLSYSLKKKSKKLFYFFTLSFVFQNQAHALFGSGPKCDNYAQDASRVCGSAPDVVSVINNLRQACLNGVALGSSMAAQTAQAANAIGGGKTQAEAGQEALGNASNTGNANVANSASCNQPDANWPSQACANAVGKLREECASHGRGSAANTPGLDQAGKASGDLKSSLLPALIGAGLGAALGYMMGKKGDESSSSSSEGEPESLPPVPETAVEEVASSSSSSSGATSSAPNGIDVPAVVQVPTVDPNSEGGGGESEIRVAAGDAILEDGDAPLEEETNEDGGTILGGTTGGDDLVADSGENPDATEENPSDEVIVENDETALGLVGKGRGLASGSGAAYQFGAAESSSSSIDSSGSGMLLGVPTRGRLTTPNAKGTTSAKIKGRGLATQASGINPKVGTVSTNLKSSATGSAQSSSVAPFRTREEIREDLRRRGLIR